MTDFARLGLTVDSRPIDNAVKSLDRLEKQGGQTERSAKGVERSFDGVGRHADIATGKVSRLRGGMGQLGFQVQDVAVQLQSGQNPLLILGQQGSQIASIFGPGGAVVGALIAVGAAVGTALLPKLFEAKSATGQLEESQENLAKTLQETKEGAFAASERLADLAKISRTLAEADLRSAALEAADQMEAGAEALSDALSGSLSFFQRNLTASVGSVVEAVRGQSDLAGASIDQFQQRIDQLSTDDLNTKLSIDAIAKQFDLSAEAASRLIATIASVDSSNTTEQLKETADTLADIGSQGNTELTRLTGNLADLVIAVYEGRASLDELNNADLDGLIKNAGITLTAFEKLEASLKKEVALYGEVSEEAKLRYEIENGSIKGLKEGQDEILLGYARQLDAKKALAEANKEAERLAKEELQAEEALQGAYEKTELELLREIELQGDSSRAAQLKFELEKGSLSELESAQKERLKLLADEADAQEKITKARQEAEKEAEKRQQVFEQTEAGFIREIELQGQVTRAAKIRYETQSGNLRDLSEQQKQILIEFAEKADMQETFTKLSENINDTLLDGFSDAIAGVEDWEEAFISAIVKIGIQLAALKLQEAFPALGGGSGIGGAILGAFGLSRGGVSGGISGASAGLETLMKGGLFSFGGGFANGGRPDPRKISLVGEKGPELFIPDGVSGKVVPMNQMKPQAARQEQPATNVNVYAITDPEEMVSVMGSARGHKEIITAIRNNPTEIRRILS